MYVLKLVDTGMDLSIFFTEEFTKVQLAIN